MANRWGNNGNSERLYVLGSKITADGDFSHEIKSCLFQGILKSVLQHHSSKASILRHSAFFTVQVSHPYMTTGKTIPLTRQTLLAK